MDEHLYEIAQQNLKNRKRSAISAVIGVVVFLSLFSYWLATDTASMWLWLLMIPVLVLTFYIPRYYESRVIGKEKNAALEEEMKRLKKLDLEIDEDYDELELRQIRMNYRDEDLV